MTDAGPGALYAVTIPRPAALPDGVVGVDAGLTLTKTVRAEGDLLHMHAHETRALTREAHGTKHVTVVGVTGARSEGLATDGAVPSQEIDAAARGVVALLAADGQAPDGDFVLALLGTGTAFAAVRSGVAQHLGGTPMGGGSFAGIARRIDPALTYRAMIVGAARGDRHVVDMMVSDAYPDGIGRIGPDLTAAHLASQRTGTLDDTLAGLLNMHGENIGQIAGARAVVAKIPRIVLAGGFAHDNPALVASIAGMTRLFGVQADAAPWPGFAGALGAALIAAEVA